MSELTFVGDLQSNQIMAYNDNKIEFRDLYDEERNEREERELEVQERLAAIEERLVIITADKDMLAEFPTLQDAYDNYKAEEEKMRTFIALRDAGGDNK